MSAFGMSVLIFGSFDMVSSFSRVTLRTERGAVNLKLLHRNIFGIHNSRIVDGRVDLWRTQQILYCIAMTICDTRLGMEMTAQNVSESPPAPAQPTRTYRRYVLGILVVVYTMNFLDRQILGILAGQIKKELVLTDSQLGLMGGLAFAMLYSTLGVPIAWLADRSSRRRIIAYALGIWSGFTALCGLATSFWQLFLARVGRRDRGSGRRRARVLADLRLLPEGAARAGTRGLLARHPDRQRLRHRVRRPDRQRDRLARRVHHRRARSGSCSLRSSATRFAIRTAAAPMPPAGPAAAPSGRPDSSRW